MKSGVELIAEERKRQIEVEGYSEEDDFNYDRDELAVAGAMYALPAFNRLKVTPAHSTPILWPFHDRFWRPTPKNRIKELVKAGALIAAQIDVEIKKEGRKKSTRQ